MDLKTARLHLSLTLAQVADRTKMSIAYLSKVERGLIDYSDDMKERLEKFYIGQGIDTIEFPVVSHYVKTIKELKDALDAKNVVIKILQDRIVNLEELISKVQKKTKEANDLCKLI